jgi:hypothetical protein
MPEIMGLSHDLSRFLIPLLREIDVYLGGVQFHRNEYALFEHLVRKFCRESLNEFNNGINMKLLAEVQIPNEKIPALIRDYFSELEKGLTNNIPTHNFKVVDFLQLIMKTVCYSPDAVIKSKIAEYMSSIRNSHSFIKISAEERGNINVKLQEYNRDISTLLKNCESMIDRKKAISAKKTLLTETSEYIKILIITENLFAELDNMQSVKNVFKRRSYK